MKNNKTSNIKRIIVKTLKRYGVRKAALFGSIARGRLNKKSDIDLLVDFNGRHSLLDLVGLKLELEKLLTKKVDILTYRSIYPRLKEKILSQQEPLL